jgi:hypothetical protein
MMMATVTMAAMATYSAAEQGMDVGDVGGGVVEVGQARRRVVGLEVAQVADVARRGLGNVVLGAGRVPVRTDAGAVGAAQIAILLRKLKKKLENIFN